MRNTSVPIRVKETVNDLRQTVNNWFERFLPGRAENGGWLTQEPAFFDWLNSTNFPAVDIEETADEVIVNAELPGLSEKDFEIELQGQRLILRGEKKVQQEKKDRSYYYTECQYGSFSRVIPLPCEVVEDKAEAKYKNGVLQIRLPKSEAAKARRIQIKVE
jgi:HSP20 family protein